MLSGYIIRQVDMSECAEVVASVNGERIFRILRQTHTNRNGFVQAVGVSGLECHLHLILLQRVQFERISRAEFLAEVCLHVVFCRVGLADNQTAVILCVIAAEQYTETSYRGFLLCTDICRRGCLTVVTVKRQGELFPAVMRIISCLYEEGGERR